MNILKRIFAIIFLLVLLLIGWKLIKKFHSSINQKEEKELTEQEKKDKKNWKTFGFDKIPEFQSNPSLVNKWNEEGGFSYQEIRDWLSIGLKPNEYEFAWWIVGTRSKKFSNSQDKINNSEPLILKGIVDIEELRKEYKDSEK